jgi:hypothetical protein
MVTLLLRVPHQAHLRIALVGPDPSCLTARTLIRPVHAGLNRLRLGPGAVKGLKPGVYIVRIPVSGLPQPLHVAVTVTPHRQIVPDRRRSAVSRACALTESTPLTLVGPSGFGAPAPAPASPGRPPTAHRRQHSLGLIPSIRNALRQATMGAGHVATGAADVSPLVLFGFYALLVAGGFFLLYPVARHLHHRHLRRSG